MIHSPKFTAILDANVLYPAPVRDLLLHLATFDLYKPKWTRTIQEEWKRNLLIKRPDLKTGQLDKTIHEMNKAFPDGSVEQYESLIPTFDLPDMDDRHVLAAAVRCHAEVIVTSNLKHFPEKYLSEFEIEAQHPDHFIANLNRPSLIFSGSTPTVFEVYPGGFLIHMVFCSANFQLKLSLDLNPP